MTQSIKYVVCLNTMGQDRKFTEDQKLAALRCVQEFSEKWEVVEKENLSHDVQDYIDRSEWN